MMGSSKPAHKRNKTLRKIPPDERDQALSDSLDNWFIKRVSERRGIIGDGRNGPMFVSPAIDARHDRDVPRAAAEAQAPPGAGRGGNGIGKGARPLMALMLTSVESREMRERTIARVVRQVRLAAKAMRSKVVVRRHA